MELYAGIAADSVKRAASGQRLISISAVPLRHAQAFIGREGSGYETKLAAAAIYATA